jgi:hypothetical protein
VREITVKGSSALRCETKLVREWLRVRCRGKNDSGGIPSSIVVSKGAIKGQTVARAASGASTLLTPYVAGTHLAAVFSWTDKSHEFVVDWPSGGPKPAILGVFKGAASPLDQIATQIVPPDVRAYACKCGRQFIDRLSPGGDAEQIPCAEILGDVNVDCALTYPDDCESFTNCGMGAPGRIPTCRNGYVLAVANQCYRRCKSDADCNKGEGCVTFGSAAGCI